jgi:hypothetical membrane protein
LAASIKDRSRPHKDLAIYGIIAPLTLFGAEFTAALFFPGYNHLTQLMSELGETGAPYASFVIANFVGMALTGILLILFAIGFFHGIESSALVDDNCTVDCLPRSENIQYT